MSLLYFIVQQSMYFSIPLLIVALGGMFSERSGVVNIALEGIMIIGAFSGTLFISFFQDIIKGQPLLILALLVSALSGVIIALAHAYASINMKADQVISGTAINMFAPAFAIYAARMINSARNSNGTQQIQFNNQFHIAKVPVLGDIPVLGELLFQKTYITTYIGFAILIIAWLVLYKTRLGLRLRACGEHPHAADSVGVNVYKMRYIGVIVSGILGAIGGLVFIIPTTTVFDATVAGYGFLALAVLIFGQWRPWRVLFAAFFFGTLKAISSAYSGIPFLLSLPVNDYFYKMLPFIVTLVVLIFNSKKSQAPRASGIPYDMGKR
ncbi:MAG: ABC transporter permease [Clostridiales bacterium]|jgi:simple sugar transport system permease protein|nr:ABC transporter permease [Clostridiales bacterium]